MILINGQRFDHISASDRGFQYGDGLFETIEVLDGHPVFLAEHLQRLHDGCNKLKIPCPDSVKLVAEIGDICRDKNSAVLKIVITRGVGGRGYRQPEVIEPTRALSLHPSPEYPFAYYQHGINARICNTRLGLNPDLAGIKHLNRLEQVMARAEWDDADIQEGIMLDFNGHVIEGTMTNLFYVKDTIVFTSPLKFAGVDGIIRRKLIQLLSKNAHKVIEQDYNSAALLTADEVFVCNSVIGIWPVKRIGDINFEVGNITKQLQHWLTESKKRQMSDAT